jgi:hypothetical protein
MELETPTAVRDVEKVAVTLLENFGEVVAGIGHPVWFEVRRPGAETFETRAVDHDFFGEHASGEVWAVALVATGRLRQLDLAVEPPAALKSGLAGGMRMCSVVSRDGDVGHWMLLPDGNVFDRPPGGGMALDTLRRAVGVPTAPPPPGSSAAACVWMWLEALQSAARELGPGCRFTWDEALRLHPLFDGEWPQVAELPACELEARVQAETEAFRWSVVRRLAGEEPGGLVEPHVASWMDDGMFARLVLSNLPTVEDGVAAARSILTGPAARRFTHVARKLVGPCYRGLPLSAVG